MSSADPLYSPVEGKTYSLFGNSCSTSEYYALISDLADKIIALHPGTAIRDLIERINKSSSKKRLLKKSLGNTGSKDIISVVLNIIDPYLKTYTEKTNEHLKSLPLSKFWDRRLATTREQYHLYMLEIEMTNRLNVDGFSRSDKKIALLPYCLQDFSVSCRSAKNGFDYQCKHCSAKCFQNYASTILKNNNIEPYIWMGGNMKQLAKYTASENKSLGILGIACIPELIWGMRNCMRNNIPVVGIPLNANRCIRWFGEFFPNSVDTTALENLVSPRT
jgi:hypothetical protein